MNRNLVVLIHSVVRTCFIPKVRSVIRSCKQVLERLNISCFAEIFTENSESLKSFTGSQFFVTLFFIGIHLC